MDEETFPVARVITINAPWYRRISRMWMVTAACISLAVGLTWYSMESPGTEISIQFPDGHGLKPGDAIRHRGIDIGMVRKIELSESLDEITVHAELVPSASAIACEGSRFWIVRPQLDLTGVSGLETAVGAKYIAVVPGGSTLKKFQFDGLGSRPPEGLGQSGMELVLRGEERHGVHPGSPLTWRGVEVGTVLSSGLSPDARHVDTRVHVFDAYRRLVSRKSKFWVTSGFQIDLGVTGVELSADSLASIAQGGIAFITLDGDAEDLEVQPGDVFTLHPKVDEAWIASASAVNLLAQEIPPVGRVEASWKQKSFGFTRRFESHGSAIVIQEKESAAILMPADLARIPEEAMEETFELVFKLPTGQFPLQPLSLDASDPSPLGPDGSNHRGLLQGLAKLSCDPNLVRAADRIASERLRIPVSPEDCFAVRNAWHADDDSAVVIEMIGKHELRAGDGVWLIARSDLNRDSWHGAVVIASQDERVIGILVVDETPVVVPLVSLLVNE